jgi:hypothetical protein
MFTGTPKHNLEPDTHSPDLLGWAYVFADMISESRTQSIAPVGAAEGCDLLILIFKNQIKRSQPAAAPTRERL